MLLQGMEGGWVVIEASHTVSSGLNVTCHKNYVNSKIIVINHHDIKDKNQYHKCHNICAAFRIYLI